MLPTATYPQAENPGIGFGMLTACDDGCVVRRARSWVGALGEAIEACESDLRFQTEYRSYMFKVSAVQET